jgi:hypothetical protein
MPVGLEDGLWIGPDKACRKQCGAGAQGAADPGRLATGTRGPAEPRGLLALKAGDNFGL